MVEVKKNFIGHDFIWQLMLKATDAENQSGSFLFAGPEGIGKKKLALNLAQKYLCNIETACGVCGSCKRVAELKHEGLLYIQPQNQMIKIEEAQNIKEFLRLRALSRKRFVIIDQAHSMNLPFANAILKTLEEPNQGVIFILISHQPKSLLATIKSRSRWIRFHNLHPMEIKEIVSKWGYDSSNFIQRGQLHLIKNFKETEKDKTLNQALGFVKDLFFERELLVQTDWRWYFKDKGHFLDFISLAPLILRDALVLRWQPSAENLILPDNKNELLELAKISEDYFFKLQDLLNKVTKEIRWSPDPVLFFEKIIFEIQQMKGFGHV